MFSAQDCNTALRVQAIVSFCLIILSFGLTLVNVIYSNCFLRAGATNPETHYGSASQLFLVTGSIIFVVAVFLIVEMNSCPSACFSCQSSGQGYLAGYIWLVAGGLWLVRSYAYRQLAQAHSENTMNQSTDTADTNTDTDGGIAMTERGLPTDAEYARNKKYDNNATNDTSIV